MARTIESLRYSAHKGGRPAEQCHAAEAGDPRRSEGQQLFLTITGPRRTGLGKNAVVTPDRVCSSWMANLGLNAGPGPGASVG